MPNLLSASSLMLAVLALVYSQWYPQISATIERNEKAKTKHPADRVREFREVEQVFRVRAMPLVLATFLLIVTLLPDAFVIIIQSARRYREEGFQAILGYSAVHTIYVLIVLLAIAFWVHLIAVALEVRELKNALYSNPDEITGGNSTHSDNS